MGYHVEEVIYLCCVVSAFAGTTTPLGLELELAGD